MKLALILGGGGANGSYQVGVIKALLEHNLLSELEIIGGTSVGALNGALLQCGLNSDEIVDVWGEIDSDILYDRSSGDEAFGIYSHQKVYDIITSKVDVDKFLNSKIKGYATVTKVNSSEEIKTEKKHRFEAKYIFLNEKANPFEYILASTAIPVVFKPIKIDDHYYVDGGLLNNLPVEVALEQLANVIIVIGLKPNYRLKKYLNNNLILNFSPPTKIAHTFLGHLDFDEEVLESKMERGYEDALLLIEQLRNEKIIVNNKIDKNQKGLYEMNNKGELLITK